MLHPTSSSDSKPQLVLTGTSYYRLIWDTADWGVRTHTRSVAAYRVIYLMINPYYSIKVLYALLAVFI